MDGKTLSQTFLDAVDKAEGDLVELQPRVIYQALDLAACEFARMTRALINTSPEPFSNIAASYPAGYAADQRSRCNLIVRRGRPYSGHCPGWRCHFRT